MAFLEIRKRAKRLKVPAVTFSFKREKMQHKDDAEVGSSGGFISWPIWLGPGWAWAMRLADQALGLAEESTGQDSIRMHQDAPSSLNMMPTVEHVSRHSLMQNASFMIFLCFLLMLSLVACGRVWSTVIYGTKDDNEDLDLDEFKTQADKGELDFYTCMALSAGRSQGKTIMQFIPKVCVLVTMQLVLGVLLLVIRFDESNEETTIYPKHGGYVFRTIGIVLFTFASYNLIVAMHDDCRDQVVRSLQKKSVSWWYEGPLLFGELMNTCIGFMLMLILYFIFCQTRRSESLLMNCIAVHFVADIDNDLVTDADTAEALDNLDAAVIEWESSGHKHPTGEQFQRAALWCNLLMRHLINVMAVLLTLMYACSRNEVLCDHMKDVNPWPFCLGITI